MPWGRLDDKANGNAKLLALTDPAWRMWGCGLIFCQDNLTDGFIPDHAIHAFGVRARNKQAIADELCRVLVPGRGPLWHKVEGGYRVHDYLDWNDSRETIEAERAGARARMALVRDPELRRALRDRDGDECRYCGQRVNWADRKGPRGATYDHVDPKGGDDLSNLVVCCRSCNAKKGSRRPDEVGMELRVRSGSNLDRRQIDSSNGSGQSSSTHVHVPQIAPAKERRSGKPRRSEHGAPVGELLDLYCERYLAIVGEKPHIDRPKDPCVLADLLKQHDRQAITAAMGAMFEHGDEFVRKHGYALWILKRQFNGFLAKSRRPGPRSAPAREPWVCPHVDQCPSPATCRVKLNLPAKYPIREVS